LLVAAITSVKEVDGGQFMHPLRAGIVQEEKKEISKVVPFMRKLIESGADVNAQVRHVSFRVDFIYYFKTFS
jgi:hypothetical protein